MFYYYSEKRCIARYAFALQEKSINGRTRARAATIAGQPKTKSWIAERVSAFFLRLGVTAFGGPAAHIAIMEDELVRRRKWLSREKFLDLLGASSLIPGPSSSELAIHIGYLRAGWAGLLLGGVCFIFPAAILVGTIAWAYVRFGHMPAVGALLYGVKPVVIAVILQALWGLGRTAVKNWTLAVAGAACLLLSLAKLNVVVLLFGTGAVVACLHALFNKSVEPQKTGCAAVFISFARGTRAALARFFPWASTTVAVAVVPGIWELFLVFVRIGSIVFGSGYVLLAFLRADLVVHRGWVTDAQLVDAVAIGQVTPGPVFTTATFLGYLLRGPAGALAATVGIFLPAFILVAISGPLIPLIRKSATAGAFLDGVNVASLALMAAVSYQLARSTIVDWLTLALAVASFVLLLRFRINSAWLVFGGAAVGIAMMVVRAH
ncbi:MAG TPA: chromate efflux transporter [Candidatus Acidoferrales bacterium]|nr:chromate efflux transporter [Candidatus Acidoferrales bacterium]